VIRSGAVRGLHYLLADTLFANGCIHTPSNDFNKESSMNRCRVSIVAVSLAVCLLGCWLLALPGDASAERYDIVVGGKLTDDARITGTTKPEGDREDDGAFVFAGLHNFVCAGAGFTSLDARIVAKLSIDKFNWTAAGMVVNHHCLDFDILYSDDHGETWRISLTTHTEVITWTS
jgi:hypothetical protein